MVPLTWDQHAGASQPQWCRQRGRSANFWLHHVCNNTQREIYQKLKKKKKLHHFFCLFFTQVSECLLLCGDDQTAIIGWEGDRQADILLFGAGHVANHRQQTDRVRITGWAEPVDLEPAGKRETSCGGESSAVCGWQPHDWTCTYRINQQMCQYQTQHSPPPIPPVEMESAVTPLTVASVGRKRQLHSTRQKPITGGLSFYLVSTTILFRDYSTHSLQLWLTTIVPRHASVPWEIIRCVVKNYTISPN